MWFADFILAVKIVQDLRLDITPYQGRNLFNQPLLFELWIAPTPIRHNVEVWKAGITGLIALKPLQSFQLVVPSDAKH